MIEKRGGKRWIDAVTPPDDEPVRARLGVAPNHQSFRSGVLRTHIVSALIASAVSRATERALQIFVRFDDTNSRRIAGVDRERLLEELTDVGQIPISDPPPACGTHVVVQSERTIRYAQALQQLSAQGVVVESEGRHCLCLRTADKRIRAADLNPEDLVNATLANLSCRQLASPPDLLPLTRTNGSFLWHLATVVDDIDLGVNLVVRGNDKINAVQLQERIRWLLTRRIGSVKYVFVPRLLETDTQASRIAVLRANGIRRASIRWYLARPFCHDPGDFIPSNFSSIAPLLRTDRFSMADAAFDVPQLSAIDRKMAAQLTPDAHLEDLGTTYSQHVEILDFISREWRRPLPQQLDLCARLTEDDVDFSPPPSDALQSLEWVASHLEGVEMAPPPAGVRWVITGALSGPSALDIVRLMKPARVARRLAIARRLTK